MNGHVVGRQPLLPIVVRLPGSPDLQLEFVVDTGFEGFLTLPSAAVAALHLPFLHDLNANLADDSSKLVEVFAMTILWEGEERDVPVLAMGRRPLIGTALLDGNDLGIAFVDGGEVTIKQRSRSTG